MHYTSIGNIHKVIDPLFLDNLYDEFETQVPILWNVLDTIIQAITDMRYRYQLNSYSC